MKKSILLLSTALFLIFTACQKDNDITKRQPEIVKTDLPEELTEAYINEEIKDDSQGSDK